MSIRVSTKEVRFTYANLAEARAIVPGGDEKYQMTIIIPKDDNDNIDILNYAIKKAYDEDEGQHLTKGGKVHKPELDNIPQPVKDGDMEMDNEIYKNHYFINLSSKWQPQVVNDKLEDIKPEEVYSGCYGRVSINFYTYNSGGRRGIGCSLGNVQMTRDGERIGGKRRTAADDFS